MITQIDRSGPKGLLAAWRFLGYLAWPFVRMALAVRSAHGKEDVARLSERFGHASLERPDGRLVWIHGASIGEALSSLPLIHRLLADDPSLHILVTTGTVTSAQLLATQLPPRAFHQFVPIDIPAAAARFMAHWRPDAVLWFESDFWPTLIDAAARSGARMALVQGRISPRSFRRWQSLPGLIAPLLQRFEICLAQSAEDRVRLAAIGATNAVYVGNLKSAAAPLAADERELTTLRAGLGSRPFWLAASTHPGEEEMVIAAHLAMLKQHPGLLTIIVPRHPQRGAAIEALAKAAGLATALRSLGGRPGVATSVYVADTLGELGLFYRLAELVYVGGSLVPHGGQNPLEPARLGCAILHGPWVQNFAEIYDALDTSDAALPVSDANALAVMASELLSNDGTRRKGMAANARSFSATGDGLVLDQIIERLKPLLGSRATLPR